MVCLFRIDIIRDFILAVKDSTVLTLNGNIFNCSVAWYSKDSLGAASDLYLRENNLIAEITACCSIFPPSSVFKQERGCFCELQIIQIEEINELGVLSSIGTCTWQKKKNFW